MANIKSQKKRIVTNEKSRQRNRACKSELKTAVRAAREAVAAGDATAAYAKALYACRLLDKAASKGIIHKNQAANRKSGIMNLVNTIVTDDVRAAYVKPEAKKQESKKLNVDRSATCPARLPWRTLPSAWAESDTMAMRPMASWRALAGDQAPPNASMAVSSAS